MSTVLGDFRFGDDPAGCTLFGYAAKMAGPARDIPEATDQVEIIVAFDDPIGRIFEAVRKARRYNPHPTVSFCGFYKRQFFHGNATIKRFEDPGQAGSNSVARLHMSADWLNWGGPLTECLPPVAVQEHVPQPPPVEDSPVAGRLLTVIAPGSAVGLSAFEATRDGTGVVIVTAQVARSKTAFAAIRNFARSWPEKRWMTVEGDWRGIRYDMKNVRCLEASEEGRLVLACAEDDFQGPGLLPPSAG